MDDYLIDALRKVAQELTEEVRQKLDWGRLGNSYGRSEFKKLLEFEAEILMAIANNV